ncbi:Auxilin-like clathrin uncoating factor SWA2 [Pseudozyma hubeiensis]|nr:Auxilin-like clathrin uncoating factor SWA2 [Pseudozyma hubeiensis]
MDDLLDLSWQPTTAKAQSSQSSSSSSSSSARNIIPNFGSTSTRPNYYGSSSSSSPSKQSPSPAALRPTTASDDAFSSLFSSSSAKQQASLSLAERQKLATEQARKKVEDDKRRNDALWSGIESSGFGGGSNSSVKPPPIPTPQRVTSPPSNSTASNKAADPWDFDAFSSTVPAPKASASTKPVAAPAKPAPGRTNDPFDFDSFDQPFSSAPAVAVHASNDQDDILGALAMPVAPKQSLSAADPRIASLSTSAATSSAGSSRVPSPASGSRPTATYSIPSRTGSPPPHILGQIVEMGFSLQQAKQALARTDTGVNVEAALELLVGNSGASRHVHDDDERLARKLQANEQRQAQSGFRDSDDEQDDYELERQRRRSQRERQQSNNDGRAPRRPQADRGASSNLDSEAAADWQQQADQFYAQASEIGSSVLTKASAFWSSAKAQAQKALDERNRAAAAADRSNTPSDAGSERHRARRWGASSAASKNKEWSGKPKWMIDAELAEADQAGAGSNDAASRDEGLERSNDQPAHMGAFKDSDNEDDAAAPEPPTRATRRPAAPVASAAPTASVASAAAAMSSAASSLWGSTKTQDTDQSPPSLRARSSAAATASASKTGYVSPNRRAPPSRSAAPSPIPPKAPLKRRPIPSDASHSISSANRNKQEGNEHFKRGAYADAETSYTRGISALESSSSTESVRLVPLLSNRANVRLKNGDATGTIADCDQLLSIVLSLFGGSQRDASGRIAVYRASQEAGLPAELAEVNLRETYGKALVRRAQALETKERWKLAKADWEVLLEYEKAEGSGVKTAASNMRFAREGLFRCGKMLGEKVVGSAVSTAPIKKSTPTAGGGEKASIAFATQQAAQAAEESARFALKDSVDAKIEAWKKGKETNLRALLTSLDTIVWEGLGWKPIGLNQVLDEGGLKKNYTKAIARLHPDKVKRGATVEQQMIAGAAFHALNEAWNAKQG